MSKIKYPYEYDPKKRKLAKIYSKGRLMSGIINGIIIPIIFFAFFYFSGLSASLRDIAMPTGSPAIVFYTFVFLTLIAIIQFPLRFYSSYTYEHKYGLSRYKLSGWFKDYSKSLMLFYLFTIPIIYGLFLLLPLQNWWIYAGVAYFFLSVFLSTILPVFILPLFYKLEPYRNKTHLKRLLSVIKSAGVTNVKGIYVANESAKSVKANALFSGLGKTKRIVLFDTLVNNFTPDEVETVIGHEAGHYIQKDIWRGIMIDTILIFPVLYIVSAILANYTSSVADIANIPLIFLAFRALDVILMPLTNAYSRHREAQADLFALETCRKPVAQASAEKRLVDTALGDHKPHPFVVFMLHTHPPAEKRVQMCIDWKRAFLRRK
ncbi:MAG: M48 family metallopeptidase [Candidatus Aenigmarchaeota archaeon]|nr:M48 family metallopeptidase [Candidatus Aenigmarchaeota archaeon]